MKLKYLENVIYDNPTEFEIIDNLVSINLLENLYSVNVDTDKNNEAYYSFNTIMNDDSISLNIITLII